MIIMILALVLWPTVVKSRAESINVNDFTVAWKNDHGLLPEISSLQNVSFQLRRTSEGLAPAVPNKPHIRTDIAAMNQMGGVLCTTASLEFISRELKQSLEDKGLMGVTVTPMQLVIEGRESAADIYFVAHLPIENDRPNVLLPSNLLPLEVSVDAEPKASQNWLIKSASAQWTSRDQILVDAESVLSVAVRLGERDGIYTSPTEGRRIKVQSIRQFVTGTDRRFDEASIEIMGQAVAEHLQMQGFKDAFVTARVIDGNRLQLDLNIRTEDDASGTPDQDEPSGPLIPDGDEAVADSDPTISSDKTDQAPPADMPDDQSSTTVTPVDADPKENEEVSPPPPSTDEPGPVDGLPYIVDPFEVAYQYPHPNLPDIKAFMDLPLTLAYIDTEDGGRNWIGPREGVPVVETSLRALNEAGGGVFWSTAIARISSNISRFLIDDDLLGVFVIPDPSQISSQPGSIGVDLRASDQTELTILVSVGRVVNARTVAQGDRIPDEEKFDHETHTVIKTASPIRPHNSNESSGRADLLRQSDISDYIHRLNRHPGRNVEASVAASAVPGGVSLDYLVFEAKPLTLYYEIGNTGTPQENGLRQRFGLFHSQFTGNDDILSLQYVTSNFSTTNAVLGSYDFRITDDNKVRGAVLGSWNKFVNDQFGQDFVDYTGFSWSAGGQLDINIFQDGPLFIDLVPGVNYQKVKVNNEIIDDSGQAGFVLPYAQVQLTRQDDQGLITGMVGIEGSPLSQSVNELRLLGRLKPSEQWARLNWSGSISTFLEPLFDPVGWADPDTPETSTLAHELAARFSGQYSFGSRLVPQFQSVLGGLYSVRGYAQSVVAGDNSLFGSIEYRFHLPRTFSVNPEPLQFMGSDFHVAPKHVYGRPDWDLIFKGFFDAGYVFQNGNEGFEVDNTLLGAGIGLEFLWKSNLRVQLDWGFALHDLKFGLAQAGSSRLYVTGTFLW